MFFWCTFAGTTIIKLMSNLPSIPPASIDLGAYGKLINPVQVDGGKIFYYWDINGDGRVNANEVEGIVTNNRSGDTKSHNWLDDLFKLDINSSPNTGTDSTDAYRFASVNGYRFALPTAGAVISYVTPPTGPIDPVRKPGTSVGSTPPSVGSNVNNSTYDDMLAIWDAYNGKRVGDFSPSGSPENWSEQGIYLWTASQ